MIRPILEKIATRRRLENKAIFFFYLIFLSPSSNSNLYVGVYAAAAHELSTFVRMTCVCALGSFKKNLKLFPITVLFPDITHFKSSKKEDIFRACGKLCT